MIKINSGHALVAGRPLFFQSSFTIFAAMAKKYICSMFACLFLAGSVLLPLGDFSLMNDLPGMYHNYTKITSPEEVGVLDFIGDYLLHGKEIFGHNEHDKTPSKGCDVQFQHQASALNVVFLPVNTVRSSIVEYQPQHPLTICHFKTSGYNNELFRPPLAC